MERPGGRLVAAALDGESPGRLGSGYGVKGFRIGSATFEYPAGMRCQ